MKKFFLFALFAFALYSLSVSAAASVGSISNINLGSMGLGIDATRQFTLTNSGDVALNGIQLAFSSSNVNARFNKSNFNLGVGQSEAITLNLTIPDTFSTGNITLGSVSMTSTQLNKTLFSVSAEITKGLLIEDLDIFLTTRPVRSSGGLMETKSADDLDVQDGDKIDFDGEDAGPGSEIRFNFNIENTFSESDDVDITDVSIILTIKDIDDGDDLDEEAEEFDVDSGKSDEADIYINIPTSVEEGTYDLTIEVEGEDSNGNTHTESMDLELTIAKESRDITIIEASVFPARVSCGGTSTLSTTIKNIGKRLEEEVQLEILNSDLGVNFKETGIEIEFEPFDGDDEYVKEILITVPANTAPGNYPLKVNIYIQEGALWDERSVNLEVACGGELPVEETVEEPVEEVPAEEEVTEEETATEVTEEEITEGTSVPVLKPDTTTEVPITKRPLFWIILALVNVLVIGAIAYVAIGALAKKP